MRSGVTNAATTTAAVLLLAMAVCDMQRVKAADPFDASTAGPGCWVIKDGGYLVDAGVDDGVCTHVAQCIAVRVCCASKVGLCMVAPPPARGALLRRVGKMRDDGPWHGSRGDRVLHR